MGEKDHSDKELAGRGELSFVQLDVIRRVRRQNAVDAIARASLLADLCRLNTLRRLDGLPGHPDVSTPFVATNTGSLGMGISKAYGMARAKRFGGGKGRIVVMTGDGELQEGQIWESLQPCVNEKLGEIVVV